MKLPKILLPLALVLVSGGAQAAIIYSGAVTDVTGDASGCCDVVSASAQVDDMNLLSLDVRFEASTFDSNLAVVAFMFDTDQDVSTGHPGIASSGTIDNTLIGVDYMVWAGGGDPMADAREFVSVNHFVSTGVFAANFLADGISLVLDMALLGGDEGLMNIKVVTVQCATPGSGRGCANYGIDDVVTDIGIAPWQTVAVSAPASALLMMLGLFGMTGFGRRTGKHLA